MPSSFHPRSRYPDAPLPYHPTPPPHQMEKNNVLDKELKVTIIKIISELRKTVEEERITPKRLKI